MCRVLRTSAEACAGRVPSPSREGRAEGGGGADDEEEEEEEGSTGAPQKTHAFLGQKMCVEKQTGQL